MSDSKEAERLQQALRDIIEEAKSHTEYNPFGLVHRLPQGYKNVIAIAVYALIPLPPPNKNAPQ